MRTQSPTPPVEETTRVPRSPRNDAAVIAQYIRDLRQAS
jgi:hypothetical protein